MELKINLQQDKQKEDRVKAAKARKKEAGYCPTIEEVFITGWTNARGTKKVAIKDRKKRLKQYMMLLRIVY